MQGSHTLLNCRDVHTYKEWKKRGCKVRKQKDNFWDKGTREDCGHGGGKYQKGCKRVAGSRR